MKVPGDLVVRIRTLLGIQSIYRYRVSQRMRTGHIFEGLCDGATFNMELFPTSYQSVRVEYY